MSTIYVCDDDPVILMMVSHILGKEHTVQTCGDIDSLISLLEVGKPDLILLDYRMPGCNGLDGLKLLRERGFLPEIPIAMVTGEKDAEFEAICFREGVEGIIQKPFIPDMLKSKVALILSRQ